MTGKSDDPTVIQAGWIDLWHAVAQAIFRTLLGLLSGSMGLAAQGVYSIGDALSKSVTLVSVKVAKRPPSKTFPFGAGKILFISALTIGIGLCIMGAFLALTSFSEAEQLGLGPSVLAIVGIAVSTLSCRFMFRYLDCVAIDNDNPALRAAAQENRLNYASNLIVILGIVFSMLGVPAADHISSFLVSLMVLHAGGVIAWDAAKGLLDVSVPRDVLSDIADKSRRVLGVRDVKLIRGRSLGEYWEIYINIAIDENVTIGEGQVIVDDLKRAIITSFDNVQHVWVIISSWKSRDEGDRDYWADHLFSLPFSKAASEPDAQAPSTSN
jgi:cation diffusion facilitator family transporter